MIKSALFKVTEVAESFSKYWNILIYKGHIEVCDMLNVTSFRMFLGFGLFGLAALATVTPYDPCTHIRGVNGLNFFESHHPSGVWVVMSCADGTVYNSTTCSCSDISYTCRLYAAGSDKFAYISDQGVWVLKTCPYGTVFKQENCGCVEQ